MLCPLPGFLIIWLEPVARISADVPDMQFGRVKLAIQLHAPRVCSVYIKPIPRQCKCQRSLLCRDARQEPSNRPVTCLYVLPLLADFGRGSRARTRDLRFWRPPLYQLSYTPIAAHPARQALPKDFPRICKECFARLRRRAQPTPGIGPIRNLQGVASHGRLRRVGESRHQQSIVVQRTAPTINQPDTAYASDVSGLATVLTKLVAPKKKGDPKAAPILKAWIVAYSTMLATMPAPTVRPPSRMAKRSFSSMAIGTISSTSTVMLSPGITISVPSGSVTMPVTSVVRK